MKTPNKIQQLLSSRPASVKADLVSFLKNLNCRYTVDTDEEDGITRISFTFQGGHFVANVKNGDNGVEFLMPVIASCEARYLNALRTVCNLMNTNNLLFKFTYSYDAQAQEHELNAHISFFNNAINPDTLENELEATFHFKRQFQGHLDDAIAKDKSEDPKDVELVFNDYTREMAIIHEMEWHHEWKDGKGIQDDAPQGFTQPHEPTIHELLTKLHDLPMVTYKTLRAYVGEQVTTLQGHNKIAAAKVLNFIVEGKGKNAHAIAPSTLLLFGGGLALGGLMYTTGLSDWIGHGIKDILGGHPSEFLFVSLFCAAALLLAEFTSHTAAINLMGTIAIGTALSLGFSPIPVAVGIALASSLGFMMPVSTPPNAIVYASGYVPITKMIKSGAIIDIIGVFCITIPIVLLLVKAVMGV